MYCQVDRQGGGSWCFTAVYGSPKDHLRHKLFSGLSPLHVSLNTPWLLLGDFNCVLALDETTSVCLIIAAKCDRF